MVMAILKPKQAYSHIATQYDKIYSSYKCEIENQYIRTILKKHKIPDGQVFTRVADLDAWVYYDKINKE